MLQLTAKITIFSDKTWEFDRVAQVQIEKDCETLTDTCKITLPKKAKWQNEEHCPIKRGDKITVRLGYVQYMKPAIPLVFSGYITKIGAKVPVVIECEDEMWKLKTAKAEKKTYKTCNLKTLLDDQHMAVAVKVFGEQNLGAYRQDKETVAELLDNLRQQGVRSFFKYDAEGTPTLHCGVVFGKQGNMVQLFDNHINLISDDGLEWQEADTLRLKVKAISLDGKNKKTVVEVGDNDGEIRTIHTLNKTESELKAWAQQELERLKQDGLCGTFDTFGAVPVDKADIIGVRLDGKDMGRYQVKKNTITYGTGGFRQSIELGARVQ